MTEKQKTGTPWIVWGALLIALGLLNLVRLATGTAMTGDPASDSGATIGLLIGGPGALGFGVWVLITGLNKRRHHLSVGNRQT